MQKITFCSDIHLIKSTPLRPPPKALTPKLMCFRVRSCLKELPRKPWCALLSWLSTRKGGGSRAPSQELTPCKVNLHEGRQGWREAGVELGSLSVLPDDGQFPGTGSPWSWSADSSATEWKHCQVASSSSELLITDHCSSVIFIQH